MEVLNYRRLHVLLGRALARRRHDAYDQAVLGIVEGYVVPELLPLVLIGWIGALTVFLLLLGHERPLLQFELDLFGLRGESHDEFVMSFGGVLAR